jgi:hypothetical protein
MTALFVFSSTAFAGPVIYSTCPSPVTDNQNGETADIYPHSQIKRYVKINPEALRVLYSVAHGFAHSNLMSSNKDNDRKQVDAWINDYELSAYLADQKADCHSNDKATTMPYAIYPYAIKVAANEPLRYRFKLCEYQVTNESQIPYDAPCRVLGDENGYTAQQLRYRSANLSRLAAELHDFTDMAIEGVGGLASLVIFHRAFVARSFTFPTLIVGSAPLGGAFWGTKWANWSDSLLSEVVEFKDSEEVALNGNLTTAIAIDRPMQDFVPYFEKYLISIKDVAPASMVSSVEVPLSQ